MTSEVEPTEPKKKASRNYKPATLKKLWGRAAARCAQPDCRIDLLVEPEHDHDPIAVIGEMCHIEGVEELAARHNANLTAEQRDDYENLILLCRNCHSKLDSQRNINTVEKIRELRNAHEEWVRANLPERGRSRTGWRVVVLQGTHPVEVSDALLALSPDFEAGGPRVVTVAAPVDWAQARTKLTETVNELLGVEDKFTTRIAVFPLAPVSTCVALGYLLTNRPITKAFQFQRDDRRWTWDAPTQNPVLAEVTHWPDAVPKTVENVAICFDLTGRVPEKSLTSEERAIGAVVRISVPIPSSDWLKQEQQLRHLGAIARRTFERMTADFPVATRWHLFYAGPAPGAVVIGQQLNPTLTPQVQLYEYQRGAEPEHQPSLVLEAGAIR